MQSLAAPFDPKNVRNGQRTAKDVQNRGHGPKGYFVRILEPMPQASVYAAECGAEGVILPELMIPSTSLTPRIYSRSKEMRIDSYQGGSEGTATGDAMEKLGTATISWLHSNATYACFQS